MTPFTEVAYAIVFGGAGGLGAFLVLSRLPRLSALSLQRRVAPYLRDIGDPLGLTPVVAVGGGWRGRLLRALEAR